MMVDAANTSKFMQNNNPKFMQMLNNMQNNNSSNNNISINNPMQNSINNNSTNQNMNQISKTNQIND